MKEKQCYNCIEDILIHSRSVYEENIAKVNKNATCLESFNYGNRRICSNQKGIKYWIQQKKKENNENYIPK